MIPAFSPEGESPILIAANLSTGALCVELLRVRGATFDYLLPDKQ
jgi:hypothetical protein